MTMALYWAIMMGVTYACCIIQMTCTPHGPGIDGKPLEPTECTQPTPQLHCDCNKFGRVRP